MLSISIQILRHSIPGKQVFLTTDISFQAAGFAVLMEDDPNQKININTQNRCPSSLWVNHMYSFKQNAYLGQGK